MCNYFLPLLLLGAGLSINAQPKFTEQLLDGNVAIGYGLAVGDVDGDRKPDILLADKKQFVWYRNGDWKRFVMVENLTEGDNVCIAARDIDGDGKVEVAVGAQWVPSETTDTLKSGSVHYLIRPKDPTQLWTPVKLHHEPTVHRMKWVMATKEIRGLNKDSYQLVVVPLHGRGNKNGEGAGVKIFAYEMQSDPKAPWKYYIIDQAMHLTHNFDVVDMGSMGEAIHIGGKEGTKAFMFNLSEKKWQAFGQKGFWVEDASFGELRIAHAGNESRIYVGISPMHGNELALYDRGKKTLLTDDLNQGHALAAADLINAKRDQVIVGWREPNKENKVGVKIFVFDTSSASWKPYWVDDNTMACEDLQIADLDGDGKKDIIAAGRATHNLKIYWNKN